MRVTINRESVVMSQDVFSHEITIDTPAKINLEQLFDDLIASNYFPKTTGNNVVWVLRYSGKEWLVWKTKENVFYTHFLNSAKLTVDLTSEEENKRIFFMYYSSVTKRALSLFKEHKGSKKAMILSGVMPEYRSYQVSEVLERTWSEQLRLAK